jgi:glycerophosphoryl diester phosphodiesterase
MDKQVATFFGTKDTIVLILGFFTFILPYIHFDRELAALPYMTRDFIKMKYEERRQAQSLGKKTFLTVYIYLIQLVNITFNPALLHLEKRGIFTAYWVLNHDSEVLHLVRTSKVMGIMTDRPAAIKPYLSKLKQN